MIKPCIICGEPAKVAESDDAALCSAACFYDLEAELERPLAAERLLGDSLAAAERCARAFAAPPRPAAATTSPTSTSSCSPPPARPSHPASPPDATRTH